jgi:hypothetical protein
VKCKRLKILIDKLQKKLKDLPERKKQPKIKEEIRNYGRKNVRSKRAHKSR